LVPDLPSASDLATLSLLDSEQGVCPGGHACRLDGRVGDRRCATCDYRGLALICWDVTPDVIDGAERGGADPRVVEWARAFVADRWPGRV
jgi:hypothetical protein